MEKSKVRFGLITDIHQDFMYQAIDRLEAFIERANQEQVDFIIQLGDFCFPKPENKEFMNVWEKFKGPKYHVLGNHDLDSCDKQTVMNFWGMEKNYYSFDCGEYHFVVLDGNYVNIDGEIVDYAHRNYGPLPLSAKNNINDEQFQWLKQDLAATDKPTIVFSHQSLENPYVGVKTSDEIQQLMKDANETAGFRKVVACLNGHNHLDGVKVIEDIYFIHMNSSSYLWMGKKVSNSYFSEEMRTQYPVMEHSVPYDDSLHAIITMEPGLMTIEGAESKFTGATPSECGLNSPIAGHVAVPKISNRKLKF